MRNTLKKLKKTARAVRLSAGERIAMREVLMRHMEAHPANSTMPSVSPFSLFDIKKKKMISSFVVGGMLMGGTMSFAAESTVPGDVLYPVKVHVNESVRGVMAVSPKAKAEWDVRLVERRLEEVEMLAVASSSPESQEFAKENFEHYAERAKTRIAEFEDEDHEEALRVAGDFSDALYRHEEKIAKISANKGVTVDMTASTTMRGVAATTTIVRNESLQGTLKKVRETRDHADEKHKELKKKKGESLKSNESARSREDVKIHNTSENISANVSVATTTEDVTKKKEKNSDKKSESLKNKERDRKEELRATPALIVATSTPTKERTEEKKDDTENEEKPRDRN